MYAIFFALIAALFVFMPAVGISSTCDDPSIVDLIAGGGNEASASVVGVVEVCNDMNNLYITYVIDDFNSCLLETHLHVANLPEGIPQTKKGNPIPGQFEYTGQHNCEQEVTYEIPLESDWTDETPLIIAVHSVVQMANSVTTDTCASVVEASTQGHRKDGAPVLLARSIPESATGQPEGYVDGDEFFSLGFGGEITLSFDSLVGGIMSVYEVTLGNNYPFETAQVSVSRDGKAWTPLGEADNQPLPGDSGLIENMLQIGSCISYVKIIDTSDATLHAANADGFDLDAVCTSFSCNEETAWDDGLDFPGKNWAMYLNYTIEECIYPVGHIIWQIGEEETAPGENPADEFNFIDFGIFPIFDDPFIIGTSIDKNFPWNSNATSTVAGAQATTNFDVEFEWDGPPICAQLTVSWSPGTSGTEQKEVFLNGTSLGKTPVRNGTYVSGWYRGEVVQDTFTFDLQTGTNTFNFKQLSGDGTLWDYVKLEVLNCEACSQ